MYTRAQKKNEFNAPNNNKSTDYADTETQSFPAHRRCLHFFRSNWSFMVRDDMISVRSTWGKAEKLAAPDRADVIKSITHYLNQDVPCITQLDP